jgi:hypothetical protein
MWCVGWRSFNGSHAVFLRPVVRRFACFRYLLLSVMLCLPFSLCSPFLEFPSVYVQLLQSPPCAVPFDLTRSLIHLKHRIFAPISQFTIILQMIHNTNSWYSVVSQLKSVLRRKLSAAMCLSSLTCSQLQNHVLNLWRDVVISESTLCYDDLRDCMGAQARKVTCSLAQLQNLCECAQLLWAVRFRAVRWLLVSAAAVISHTVTWKEYVMACVSIFRQLYSGLRTASKFQRNRDCNWDSSLVFSECKPVVAWAHLPLQHPSADIMWAQ